MPGWASQFSGPGVPSGSGEAWVMSEESPMIEQGGGKTTEGPERVAEVPRLVSDCPSPLCRQSAQI